MTAYRDRPLRQKLLFVLLLSAGTALLLAWLVFALTAAVKAHEDSVLRLSTLARATTHNLTAALTFDDEEAAREILGSLRADDSVLHACVTRADGSVFVDVDIRAPQHDCETRAPEAGGVLPAELHVVEPVVLEGEHIGVLHLVADLGQVRRTLALYLAACAALSALALLLAALLGARLLRRVTAPVLGLADTARRVSDEANYALRATRTDNDEVGRLVDSFNAMLGQIEQRDAVLAQHRERLEQAVAERTAELERARAAAEAASSAKSRFLATMSHEIRTPMNAVLGMTELLLASELKPAQRAWAETVHRSGETLLAVLNDVLDFSKIEAGKLQLEQIVFDPRRVVGETVALMGEPAHAKGLALNCDIAPALAPALRGDPNRLSQVLINLVGNAIKFTDRGAIDVRVEVLAESAAGQRLRLVVSDTGIGMDSDMRARIYRPFEQADSSHARRYGGTGLGLAIVKQLVDLMGGTLAVDSAPGAGSRFVIELELPVADAAPAVIAAARVPAAQGTPALPAAHVLLVEDNVVNQQVARAMLESTGCTLDVAGNGREALAAIARGRYDLVFMDCQMPEMDGFEATRRIRDRERETGAPHLPVIAITASVMSEERDACLACGMDDVLNKPYGRDALFGVLRRWLPAGGRQSEAKA